MAATVVVRGGTVVTPTEARPADIVVAGGQIAALMAPGTADRSGAEIVDAGGLLVFPGMVDADVRLEEGLERGTAAAAAGGVTTVVDLPVERDRAAVTAALIDAKVAAVAGHSRIDVALWGGLVPASVAELDAMAAAGACGFQAFASPSGWDNFPPVDDAALTAGFEAGARLDLPVALHCELESHGRSPFSEVAAVRWAAELAAEAGGRLHVLHVSAAAAVDEARWWHGVTVETCPHYLLLAEDGAQFVPPIRDAENQERLWELLRQGSIDIVASGNGVGLTLPLLISDGRLELFQIARLTTAAARLLRLPGKGSLAPGSDADLALVDPDRPWAVGPGPFAGRPVKARVVRTLVRGRTVFTLDDGPLAMGHGQIVRPGP